MLSLNRFLHRGGITGKFWRNRALTSVHTYQDTQRIQKFPLWRAYTEISGYTERIRRTRVDARCIHIKKFADTKISGYVWTGP